MNFSGIRSDFPFITGKQPIIYLDTAATSQKPRAVIDAIADSYAFYTAPVHRGVYALAEQVTQKYEDARATVAHFINAHVDEVIFTSGTTHGINFVAYAWADKHLQEGDEVIVTYLEHHANLVPWIRLAQQKKLVLKYVKLTVSGTLDYEHYLTLLTHRTKLVACTHTSNVLGCTVDVAFITAHAHAVGALVLVDAAQSIAHRTVDVRALDADFLVFSGHKMLGPTGIGVLYIKSSLHELIEPYQVGGGMVYHVQEHAASWAKSPRKYEAGTPPIIQVLGLAAAIDYITNAFVFDELSAYEGLLCKQLIESIESIPGLSIMGPLDELMSSGHMVSFYTRHMHAHDIAAYLNNYGIAVRAGNQCTQPLHTFLGITASVRISFYAYNTSEEVDKLSYALTKLLKA